MDLLVLLDSVWLLTIENSIGVRRGEQISSRGVDGTVRGCKVGVHAYGNGFG